MSRKIIFIILGVILSPFSYSDSVNPNYLVPSSQPYPCTHSSGSYWMQTSNWNGSEFYHTHYVIQSSSTLSGYGMYSSQCGLYGFKKDYPSSHDPGPQCPVGYIFNNLTNMCDETIIVPDCDVVGYNPDAFYPSGYCVYYDGVPGSAPDSQCQGGETLHDIPNCKLAPCPDGSYVDTSLGQSCAIPNQCWDGSIIYGDSVCPPPPYTCPDGTQVSSQTFCPDPTQDSKQCSDGSVIPLSSQCPSTTTAHCLDGSTVSNISECSDQSGAGYYQCSDGSIAQDSSNCPLLQTSPNNTNDSIQTTISGTTPSGSVDLTVDNQLNLDSINSRLDKINQSVNNQDIQGIIDAINNKETDIDTSNIESLLEQIKNSNNEQNEKLGDLNNLLNQDSNEEPDDDEDNQGVLDGYLSDLQNNLDGFIEGQGNALTGFVEGLGDINPFGDIEFLDKAFWLPSFPSHSNCSGSIDLSVFGRPIAFDPCDKLAPLREVLAWVFYVLFFIRIFNMLFTIHEVN